MYNLIFMKKYFLLLLQLFIATTFLLLHAKAVMQKRSKNWKGPGNTLLPRQRMEFK